SEAVQLQCEPLGYWRSVPGTGEHEKTESATMNFRLLTVVPLALLLCSAAAQVSQFEGRRIVDIQLSPAQILDPADLAKALPLKKGEPLRAEDVGSAIDGLFATGRFE